jgi:hypothetical protein
MNNSSGKMTVVVADPVKRPRRRATPFYKKKLEKLSPGQIARISIYNWRAECSKSPKSYIHRVYNGNYQVIEQDEKGFIVLCLRKRERFI